MSSYLPLVLSSTAVLLTMITAGFSVLAYAKVIGMEKSTHKMEYVPLPVPEGAEEPQTGKELLKGLAPEDYSFYDEDGFKENR